MVSMMFEGTGQSRSIVNDLARDMQIDPELSQQLAAMSRSTQPYLYAVSTPVCPATKQSSAKYDYVEATIEQKPTKANAKPVKPGRAPQPLPHQHLIAKESLGLDPNRRPLSLNDLRPPPTSPPPPLPKNGRLTLVVV